MDKHDDDLLYGEDPTRAIVNALIRRDGDDCVYCEIPFSDDQDSKWSRTVDHYHSIDWCRKQGWSATDTHGMANLRLSHRVCNSVKSNREWLEDGTLAPKASRPVKAPRPDHCNTCNSGRKLYPGERCAICNGGAQPTTAPTMLKRSPTLCDHRQYFCSFCFVIQPELRLHGPWQDNQERRNN